MPLKVTLTPTQLKARKVVEPDWHAATIKDITRQKNKAGDSYNYVVDLVGLEGEAQDVPFKTWISEKDNAIGQLAEIAWAAGLISQEERDSADNTGVTFDVEEAIGNRVEIKTALDEFNGQPTNRVVGFRPPRG